MDKTSENIISKLLKLLNTEVSSETTIEIIKIFENKKISIDAILDEYENTALTLAVQHGQIEIIKYLVANGANIEAANSNGVTALIIAAYKGNKGIVEYLVDNDANIEAVDSNGVTELFAAAYFGHGEIVEYLVDNGADK